MTTPLPPPGELVDGLHSARDDRRQRRAQRGRRLGTLAMLLVVALAASGLLGVRTSTREATHDGWTLRLTQADVARAGWDVPWRVEVRHPGGFGTGSVTLAVTRSFFDIYEQQGMHPEPQSQNSDGDVVYLEFAPPPGEVLSVDYDAYIQPSAQLSRPYAVTVVTHGTPRVQLRARTWLLP